MPFFVDRVHRLPRIWSNRELQKYAHLFKGKVVNVSGWKDMDKEGRHYKDYFTGASSYTITNFKSEARGLQGNDGEIYLDLENDLPDDLAGEFDVVYNHTTLEHVYEARKAFANLCGLSNDIVVIVLPFLQQYHADYGDFWRFTPLAVKRLFEENGLHLVYQSFNNHKRSSVYTFSIATRYPEKWCEHFSWSYSHAEPKGSGDEPFIGCRAIPNHMHRVGNLFNKIVAFPKRGLQRILASSRR